MYTENNTVAPQSLEGGVTRKILSYSKNLMTVELRFPKGGVGAKHSHPHEQIGVYCVRKIDLSGGGV